MGATSASPAHRRWSSGVIIVLLVSLVGVVFVHSPSVYGVDDYQSVLDRSAESVHDFEVGENDFRISDMGPDEVWPYSAYWSSVVYNSTNHEYLVVWTGDNGESPNINQDIYGQRIDAATGAEIGEDDFRISHKVPDGGVGYSFLYHDVVYNSDLNEYLVVWSGGSFDDSTRFTNKGVFGQRLDGETGAEVGIDDFRIDQTLDNTGSYPFSPVITYNNRNNEYIVVWSGAYEGPGNSLFSRRLAINGSPIGEDNSVIKRGVLSGSYEYNVAYNPIENEYLVVWSDSRNIQGRLRGEIFGQRLDGLTGTLVGVTAFRVSDQVSDFQKLDAGRPSIAYNSRDNEYLVTWMTYFDDRPDNNQVSVLGQRLDGTNGTEIGNNDFSVGGDIYSISNTAIIYQDNDNTYFVTWSGFDQSRDLLLYGQQVNAIGQEFGVDDFLIGNGSGFFAIAYNNVGREYLVTWTNSILIGEDDYENDIFGQRLAFHDDITPIPTTPPACDPERDVWGKIRGLGWVEIGNRSQTCTYPVGGAIYIIPSGNINDPDIDSQVWYDDTTSALGPGERITVRVAIPACVVVQQDAFWGEPLRSLDGQRYGERLLAAARYHTGGTCDPTPSVRH
ncbi:MAG: hypothetical protein GFH27_549313n77 [Chloroflexi bacterium AL-W]|nr:hypothetical protein [Chloroflexi bacterium AL-N1]NOK69500.1 hypothetical protein [Chloroflexi bacterium AL-N10]NOK77465.1 hypothetical protein [Chloroflexi bacterium AL-N5]NOK84316.1 hypothetical protein [Chloroflexi bacterium AL-W]NOK91518.1 hypothetical protein [Chloroflexi bacterium AL-N15]